MERINIILEKESISGDELNISATLIKEGDNITSIHTIKNQEEKELTKLEILWKKQK